MAIFFNEITLSSGKTIPYLIYNGSYEDFIAHINGYNNSWICFYQFGSYYINPNDDSGQNNLNINTVHISTDYVESYSECHMPIDYIAAILAKLYSVKDKNIISKLLNDKEVFNKYISQGSISFLTSNSNDYTAKTDKAEYNNHTAKEEQIKENYNTLDEIVKYILDDPEIISLANKLKDIYSTEYTRKSGLV